MRPLFPMRPLVSLSSFALAIGITATTLLGLGQPHSSSSTGGGIPVAHAQASSFQETFTGRPSNPTPYRSANWDILTHSRDVSTWQQPESMMGGHGADCAAHPAEHLVSQYPDTVYQCNDHLMTAINASGYGAVYLTPNQLVDFSSGEATINVDLSTLRTSHRDWIDIWVTPYEENVPAPLDSWLPDLTGTPKRAIHIRMDVFNGDTTFRAFVINNFEGTEIESNWWTGYESFLTPSAVRRDTFQLKLSKTSLKFGMPAYNFSWTNAQIPTLNWSRGVVQLSHHSYNPTKDCSLPTCTANTWHWDNLQISPAVPFTILPADRPRVNASSSTVTFAEPAPADSHLRFLGIGSDLQASVDGGPWMNFSPRQTARTADEVFKPYWLPVPAGTRQIAFRGSNWWGGPWAINDPSIWSQAAPGSAPAPTATATTSAATVTATAAAATATASAVTVTATPTSTPAQPAATATPTSTVPAATVTATSVPATATATATQLPATAPPTSTAAPATATSTAAGPAVPAGSYLTSATASPASVTAGGTASVTAAVTSGSAGTILVDVEIYSASGVKMHQQYFDNQTFAAGQQRTYPVTWDVPAGTAAGTYTVMIGTFSAGWGINYHWNGNAATVTVTASSDTTPPVISNVQVASIARRTASVRWTTNEAATHRVEYGTTPALGSMKTPSGRSTSHAVGLSGLTPNTTYHYRVVTADAAGNTATSSVQTFTTLP